MNRRRRGHPSVTNRRISRVEDDSPVKKGVTVKLTAEQERAIHDGQAVQVTVGGAVCVLLRKDIYERGEGLDYSPWTKQNLDLLAAEAPALFPADDFNDPDESLTTRRAT